MNIMHIIGPTKEIQVCYKIHFLLIFSKGLEANQNSSLFYIMNFAHSTFLNVGR